jgi:cobalamin biosynthesis protein CobT
MRLNKAECERAFLATPEIQNTGALRSNLMRLLRSIDLVGWSSYEESGRLDRRALTRFASGSANIFSRRQVVEAEKSAVSLLIDLSSSMMKGVVKNDVQITRIEVLQDVTIQLSRLLDRAKVDFSVTGFYQDSCDRIFDVPTHNGEKVEVRAEPCTFVPFKQWREPLVRCVAKLGSIQRFCKGATPAYIAIEKAIEDLAKQDTQRKILFILTDAESFDAREIKHLDAVAERLGIKMIAVGIQTHDTIWFKHNVSVMDLQSLGEQAFSKLLKEVARA